MARFWARREATGKGARRGYKGKLRLQLDRAMTHHSRLSSTPAETSPGCWELQPCIQPASLLQAKPSWQASAMLPEEPFLTFLQCFQTSPSFFSCGCRFLPPSSCAPRQPGLFSLPGPGGDCSKGPAYLLPSLTCLASAPCTPASLGLPILGAIRKRAGAEGQVEKARTNHTTPISEDRNCCSSGFP